MPKRAFPAAAEGMPSYSRRAVLGGIAGLSLSTGAAVASPPVDLNDELKTVLHEDPVFQAIRRVCSLREVWSSLGDDLDEAEQAARKRHGSCPAALVKWDHYSAIGHSEVDAYREWLLSVGGRDPQKVEAAYLVAKEELRAKRREKEEWVKRAGLRKFRKRLERARLELDSAEDHLAGIMPTSPSGAAAMIKLAVEHLQVGDADWPWRAISTATKALEAMNPPLVGATA